jgi:NDP-sugar pyrophosphorylase family protein
MATIATFKREVNMEFGVIEKNKKSRITGFSEKPHYHFDVSMGVNVFSGDVLDLIPKGTPFGFDQLMISLIENHKPVFSYPHEGYWLDIGKPDDYARSVEEFEMYKKMLLPGML